MIEKLAYFVRVYRAIAIGIEGNNEPRGYYHQYLESRMKTLREVSDDIEKSLGICIE